MSGGFIFDPSVAPRHDSQTSTSVLPSNILLSLTPRQEGKLRTHLDNRLLSLERDARKHAFNSLRCLLPRFLPLLHLILQIPPLEPWAALRISYLLTFTGSVPTYITSLPLVSVAKPSSTAAVDQDSDMQVRAARTMRALLAFLNEVDRGWIAVLRGDGWSPPSETGGMGKAVKVDFGGSVGATERIRLRSIIIAGREKVLAFARTYGNFGWSSFPEEDGEVDCDADHKADAWELEEILGMWNGTLEMLADHDFDRDDAYA